MKEDILQSISQQEKKVEREVHMTPMFQGRDFQTLVTFFSGKIIPTMMTINFRYLKLCPNCFLSKYFYCDEDFRTNK